LKNGYIVVLIHAISTEYFMVPILFNHSFIILIALDLSVDKYSIYNTVFTVF